MHQNSNTLIRPR